MGLKKKVLNLVQGEFEDGPKSLDDWIKHVASTRKLVNEWIDKHEQISSFISHQETSLKSVIVDLLQQFDGKLNELNKRERVNQQLDNRVEDLLAERDDQRREIHNLQTSLRMQADENKQEMLKRESMHHRMLEDVTHQHSFELDHQLQKHKHAEQNMMEKHEHEQRNLINTYDSTLNDKEKNYSEEVRRLKNALVSSSETEVPLLTDTMLKEQVQDLGNMIKSLASSPFGSNTPDLARLVQLLGLPEQMALSMMGRNRRLLLESAIWSILMESFFTTPLGMNTVGSVGQDLMAHWCQLFPNSGKMPKLPLTLRMFNR